MEVHQQPEPRGGRWEEAESPQLLHRHSLFENRKRTEPPASADVNGMKHFILFYFFVCSKTVGGVFIGVLMGILESRNLSWHAAVGASFIGFVGCVVRASGREHQHAGAENVSESNHKKNNNNHNVLAFISFACFSLNVGVV